MRIPKFVLAGLLVVSALASCQKDDKEASTKAENPSTESTEDIAMSMNIDEEITSYGQMGMEGSLNSKKSSSASSCMTISLDTTGATTKFILDFGTTNCTGADGKQRRGQLILSVEDNPFDPGSVLSITSNGFALNDHEVTGSKAMTFMGLDANNDPYLTLVTALSIQRPDGKTIVWNSNQTRTWTDGFATLDPNDNAAEVTGTANGLTADSIAYNINVLTPLRAEATCGYLVSGSFKLSSPVFTDRIFDYGNGTCDNVATVTVNGNTYTFNM